MYSAITRNTREIKQVLNNLCDDTVIELVKTFGKDYKRQTFAILRRLSKKYVIRLKQTNEPVGLFGLIPLNDDSAGIFLLTTDNLHKGNLITFKDQNILTVNKYMGCVSALYIIHVYATSALNL